jgi:hypothetical protein
MLRQYQLHGGIRRLQPRFGQSKQFGTTATMAASAAPTPWNCPPPLVDDFRWWDNICLALPLPPTFDEPPDYHKGRFLIAPQHGGTHGALVSALESISSCLGISSKKNSPGKGTLKTLPMFLAQPSRVHHFRCRCCQRYQKDPPPHQSNACFITPSPTSP